MSLGRFNGFNGSGFDLMDLGLGVDLMDFVLHETKVAGCGWDHCSVSTLGGRLSCGKASPSRRLRIKCSTRTPTLS